MQQLPLAAGRVKLKGMKMKKGREMERNGNELNELMIFTLSNYICSGQNRAMLAMLAML